jgi:putative ABC transport system permease protein
MLSLYSTLSARYLRRRWFRALLIVASIALGVATLVATRALNETMTRAGLASLNPMAGAADLLVSNGEAPVDVALAGELARAPGVAAALPRVFATGQVVSLNDSPVLLLGIDRQVEQKAQEADRVPSAPKLWEWSLDRDVSFVRVAVEQGKWKEQWRELLPLLWDTVRREVPDISWRELPQFLGNLHAVLLGKELADRLPEGKKLVRVRVAGRPEPVLVLRVGTVSARGAAEALSGNVVVMLDLDGAAQLAGFKKGQVSRIDLTLSPGADRDVVKEEVAHLLRGRAEVNTPEEKNEMIGNVMAGMQTGFGLCGLAALVVGLFLVYNALSVSVTERRHEIGILLSVGATRRQVRSLFAGEAAVLGLAGSLLGLPLGVGLAYLMQPLVQGVLRDVFTIMEPEQIDVSPRVMVAALVAGIVTAVAACVVPAVSAAREKPAEAVRRVPQQHGWRYRLVQLAASALMVLLGTVLILLRGELPARVGIYGGLMLVLLGALLATPLLAAVAARLLQPGVRLLFGIETRLAADNLVRSPQRTGLVIAALAAGVALVMQTAGTIRSNRQAFHDWARDAFGFDLTIKSGSAVGAGGPGRPMDAKLASQMEKVKGVERVLPMRTRKFPYRDTQVQVVALDAAAFADVNAERDIAGLDLYRRLSRTRDGAVISENFAALHHVRTGDVLTLASTAGPVHLRVLGQLVDYSWNHGTILVNRADYQRHWDAGPAHQIAQLLAAQGLVLPASPSLVFPQAAVPLEVLTLDAFALHWDDDKVDTFDVYLHAGADEKARGEVREAILHRFAQHGLVVLTKKELQDLIDAAVEKVYSIAYMLQVTVMLVAALGVVTAFLISVLQRRREMGLLRAIGASQAQVVRSVLAEAALMGVIGTAIGLAVGVPMEWFVLRVAILEESGYLFALYIPWVESLVIAAAALVLATLAGLGPAVYAVRQRIPEAIAYE